MAWAAVTMALSKGTTVLSMLVLARLLVPADFGLFAVGLLLINYMDRIKDVGIGSGLIYRREDWRELAPTGLSLSVSASALTAGAAFLAAPLAAGFFHDPRLDELLRALALVILISGLAIVPDSRMRRELDFRRRVIPETAASVVKGIVAIALAYVGLGVWALVWGQAVGTAAQAVLYWTLAGWRPRFGWRGGYAKKLLRYGVPSMFVAVLAVVHENLDYLIIGRRMDADELGFYFMAYRIPELVVIGVCIVAGQVLFPMFSRLQDDMARLGDSYLTAVQYIALLTTAAAVLIALLAPEVVGLLYGDGWQPAVPALRFLALFSAVYALSFHAGEVYKATGRPGILNTISIGKIILLGPVLWLAAGHSIVAVALVLLAGNVVLTVLKLAIVIRIADLSWSRMLHALAPALTGAVTMGVVVALAGWATPVENPLVRLSLLAPVGLAAFVLGVWLVAPSMVREIGRRTGGRLRPAGRRR